ncbi:MAG: glycosyltransferase family A protein [Saprospiraceae bacterium]|nr:glycosyltransferase family A protein [Saprospiraceae bacterium]
MVSIIVCTLQRDVLLARCLQSIAEARPNEYDIKEVIVVNNGTDELTANLISDMQTQYPVELVYTKELQTGLSFARNKGAASAKGSWLFYLDDDGFVHSDAFLYMQQMIQEGKFDIFGGIYKAIHLSKPPRWLDPNFGTKKVKASKAGPLNDDAIEGGIMVLKKEVWTKVGGFNTTLGMMGDQPGFGEETDFVQKAIDLGFKAGIQPAMVMDHVVGEHKYKIGYHLRSYQALGRDMARTGRPLTLPFGKTLLATPFRFCRYGIKWLGNKNYYLQNWIWDVWSPLVYVWGYKQGLKNKQHATKI